MVMRLTSVVSYLFTTTMSSSSKLKPGSGKLTSTIQRQQHLSSLSLSSSNTKNGNKNSNNDTNISWFKLSKAWAKDFVPSKSSSLPDAGGDAAAKEIPKTTTSTSIIAAAISRTLPMLADGDNTSPAAAVPFICRYRTDVITPLTTQQIHVLAEYLTKHQKLASLRSKILNILPLNTNKSSTDKAAAPAKAAAEGVANDAAGSDSTNSIDLLRYRVETSISKTELEDIYAPYKPTTTGSLEDRILKENPDLVEAIDKMWLSSSDDRDSSSTMDNNKNLSKLIKKHKDSAITLLANRIASYPPTMDACYEYTQHTCRIVVSQQSKATTTSTASKKKKSADNKNQSEDNNKFQTYYNFEGTLNRLKDYQILAIRRGVDKKALKMKLDIEGDKAQRRIRHSIREKQNQTGSGNHIDYSVWQDAVTDAWTRLLKKRCTTRCWKDKCIHAEERAINVFCINLRKALLEPPSDNPPKYVLAVDPGYKAGIKIAMLDPNGNLLNIDSDEQDDKKKKKATKNEEEVSSLTTVYFTDNRQDQARNEFAKLIQIIHKQQPQQQQKTNGDHVDDVIVALGNGHGSQDARQLLLQASESCGIPIDIQLVNEAGASVWSVTEAANKEFPNEPPASIAAISIGRRYQNPLPELVKIPPRSLGLGMYQHDFATNILEEKLDITSIDAVAEVGIHDVNACSIDILSKVPGITKTLAQRIIKSRPIRKREDLLSVSGLGPKTYENCAAFIRVQGGPVDLDRTLVHPESYDLGRYILKKLQWDLNDNFSIDENDFIARKDDLADKAASRFGVSKERVRLVIDHLYTSITNPDPRLRKDQSSDDLDSSPPQYGANTDGCTSLPANLASSLDKLRRACPIRNIRGTVRNVVDFGLFVDFGSENDALVHTSKIGGRGGREDAMSTLNAFLVGQEIGIDILGVSNDGNRITASLSGLNLPAESTDTLHANSIRKPPPASRGRSSKSEKAPNKRQRTSSQARSYSSTSKRSRK